MATICDIAKAAGVSIATVSRVVNGKGYVKDETRIKVERAIAECGYRPNALARSLITKETSMIGLVMPERLNPFFITIYDGVGSRADETGQNILFYNTSEDVDREHKAIQYMMEQQVQGLLITPVVGSDDETSALLAELESSGIPVILIDRDLSSGAFDAVFIDNKQAVYEGTRALAQAGHQKIGLLLGPETARSGRTRREGYCKCLEEAKIPVCEEYIFQGEFTQESGYEALSRLMALPQPPTAVFASNSSQTLGCIRYFSEHFMTPGKDIGFLSFDDISLVKMMGYNISVIDRPARDMGEAAFDMLLERIHKEGEKGRCREVVLQTQVILRGSEAKTGLLCPGSVKEEGR